MRRLVCTEGGAKKFWEGTTEGTKFIVRFGRIGTAGQTKEKVFASAALAEKELGKVAGEKLRGGYVEEVEGPAPAAAAPNAPQTHATPAPVATKAAAKAKSAAPPEPTDTETNRYP